MKNISMIDKKIILEKMVNDAKPLIEQMSQIVFFKSTDSIHVDANSKLVNFSKLNSAKNIIGKNDYNLPWAEAADFYTEMDKEILLGLEKNIAMHVKVASGEYKAVIQNKKPVRDVHGGDIVGIMIVMEESKDKIINEFFIKDRKIMSHHHLRSHYCLDSYSEYNLTKRESECLFYTLRGMQAKAIANILGNSPRTVEKFIGNLMHKFGCHCKSELISKALEYGLADFIPPSVLLSAI